MKLFKYLLAIATSAFVNLSFGLDVQQRWVANRSSGTWRISSDQTDIKIIGILDKESSLVSESTTERVSSSEWKVLPGQILVIEFQLNSVTLPVNEHFSGCSTHTLRLIDSNSIRNSLKWCLETNSGPVTVSREGAIFSDANEDAFRLNYPAPGDIVIWGDTHISGKGYTTKERWVVNKSSATWTFFAKRASVVVDGIVNPENGYVDYTISDQSVGMNSQGYSKHEIYPGQTMQIVYRLDYDDTPKIIALMDQNSKIFSYSWEVTYSRRWQELWTEKHISGASINGGAGKEPVYTNYPAEGDIDIHGNYWI